MNYRDMLPAMPPRAVTRLEGVQRRLDECEAALHSTELECQRRGAEVDRLRKGLVAIRGLPVAYPDRTDEARLLARNLAVATDWAARVLEGES